MTCDLLIFLFPKHDLEAFWRSNIGLKLSIMLRQLLWSQSAYWYFRCWLARQGRDIIYEQRVFPPTEREWDRDDFRHYSCVSASYLHPQNDEIDGILKLLLVSDVADPCLFLCLRSLCCTGGIMLSLVRLMSVPCQIYLFRFARIYWTDFDGIRRSSRWSLPWTD